jgi:type II secretory ATPase GspE/PulE/Tfp pilus assembly ATPase PilB-like protein/ActR/RegA family two-component response regulator
MHNQDAARVRVVKMPGVGLAAFPALLMDRGLISRGDLLVAQQHAHRENMELADAFVALGLVNEGACYAALAVAAGLPLVDAVEMATSELAVRLIPERLARRHDVVPLSVDNRTLTYATCRPFDPEAERDLSFASGRRTRATVAPRSGVQEALDRCYPKLRELDVLAARLNTERPDRAERVQPRAPSESAVVNLCDHLIARAIEVGASDVHVECGTTGTTVRYRICGVLEPVLTLPASVSHPIRNRLKIMARADIAVQHRPQDGAFQVNVNGRPIDVRLSTLPTVGGGEKIVMRVIDSCSPMQTLERLAYDDETLARLCKSLARPDGLVLVTGPTGSGKTTALYAALGHLRTGRTNIVSVEDPVERTVAGVTQIPVNGRAGNTFSTVLKSLMRQDPNVIMVGEIRDEEVAQIVGQAAYTGHLVLTSMHTVDAATAITRLSNLGLEPYKIAESLSAVLAQRLVRSLCPACKVVHEDEDARRRGVEHNIPSVPVSAGAGCQHCNQTGYFGRVPVAELLTPSDELRDAISRGATANEIRSAMRAAGYPTMRDHALQLVAAGITSIEEVNRVLSDGESAREATREHPRILVVDDDAITRMLVKMLLARERYEVLEAANGRDAVEIASRERPDLLLIDLNMPEMDGYQAIAALRKDLSLATLPIVVLTSEEGPGIERRVLELGADDYMLKPFDPDVLLSRVNAVFRRMKVMAA